MVIVLLALLKQIRNCDHAAGEVHVTLSIDDTMSSLEIAAGMTCDEGLNSTDSCPSPVTEPPTIPVLDETGMVLFVLLLASGAVLSIRRRDN